jgi:hypothetical protein
MLSFPMLRPLRPLPTLTISRLCRCWALARPLSAALCSARLFIRPLSQKCVVLTPFPATLTGHRQLAENTTTLSPAVATLTIRVMVNPFVCHSYRKHPGWGSHPSSQGPIRFCLGPRLFWNWHLRSYPGAQALSFRPIRVPQPILPVLFQVSPVTDHRSRTTSHQSQVTKPFRIRTYEKRVPNSFRIRTSKTRHLKPFRMNTYKKTGEGPPRLSGTMPNQSVGARHVVSSFLFLSRNCAQVESAVQSMWWCMAKMLSRPCS